MWVFFLEWQLCIIAITQLERYGKKNINTDYIQDSNFAVDTVGMCVNKWPMTTLAKVNSK